ncbi:toxin VasX [Gilliamella sp. CG25]|uniref:toxin VasX n=1 Tax=unclassified Gilliamella TaxID=2685620 RepID=UPI0039877B91
MNKAENIVIENKNEACGNCLACGRTGIPVFLLRQAVIKMKPHKTVGADPDYQELANYTKNLNFKSRMPDEELNEYGYILRTLRDGYIYVMQQQGEDINSRIIHTYECIEGALRLKNNYELACTEPRPLSKACKNHCHTIPAAFIHLQQDYTQAWVAYSAQPWSTTAVEDYLKEQDNQVLSRFTKIDITNLAQSPAEATGNRAVPFTDIFGQVNNTETPSKVLEFRFDDNKLPFFESAHPFNSFKQQKQQFATHASQLYKGSKPISCGVVLEDTFGIAEELNTQRIVHLHIFNEQPLTDDEINLAEETINGFDDIDNLNKIYEQRAKNMFKTINPKLQRQFNYYKPVMFKKRMILQLIEQYRSSIISVYDQQIAKVEEEIENFKNSGLDTVGYNGIPESTRMLTRVSRLYAEKREKLKDFDDYIDQGEIEKFNIELEKAYKEVVNYHKEWSLDYFTYARWLFGKDGFTSAFTETKPLNVNTNHFWQREFDFSSQDTQLVYLSQVTNMLLDTTHSEIKLDEDSALWDELLSNPESIYYISEYDNPKGIDQDKELYVDLTDNSLLKPLELISNATKIFSVINRYTEEKHNNELENKLIVLRENKKQAEAEIKQNQQKIAELEKQKQNIPASDPAAQEQLRKQKKGYEIQIQQLNKELKAIEQQLSNLTQTAETAVTLESKPLANTALKKQAILAKDTLRFPIKSEWMRLNAFDQLAKLGALPVEINVEVRPANIAKIQNLFTQMHRSFFNRGIYHPHELAFLDNFDIDEKPVKTGAGKVQKVKFTLCFPDIHTKTLFVNFINSINGKLSPYNLKQFMEQAYKDYFKLKYQQKIRLESLEHANRGKTTTTQILNETSDKNTNRAKTKIDDKIGKVKDVVVFNENQKNQSNIRIKIEDAENQIKKGKFTFKVNLAVSGVLGCINLMNINDMLKDWDKVKEGNGTQQAQQQLFKELLSLGLIAVDITSQYQYIKLNRQLKDALYAGKNVNMLNAKINLNSMISTTVNKVFGVMSIIEAGGEFISAFGLLNMEDKTYFILRSGGALLSGIGSFVLIVAGGWMIILIGAILAISGAIMIMFSKKYDNLTPIQHWLNRCCFGTQKELDYLGYSAYQEEDYNDHSGFGAALNDYAVMVSNIQTFIRLLPPYLKVWYSSHRPGGHNPNRRHVYFYLDIPDFSKYNQNESATALIRIFITHFNDKIAFDPVPERYIDLKCRITTENIEVLEVIKYNDNIEKFARTDKNAYFEKYEREYDPITGKPLPDDNKIIEPAEFTLITSANNIQTETHTNVDEPIKNGLIINKWIAGTIGEASIEKYHIMIQYNKYDDVPLIINKKSKI